MTMKDTLNMHAMPEYHMIVADLDGPMMFRDWIVDTLGMDYHANSKGPTGPDQPYLSEVTVDTLPADPAWRMHTDAVWTTGEGPRLRMV